VKTDETVFYMGDLIPLHRCDNCNELIDGIGFAYWEDKDFTLCLSCISKLLSSSEESKAESKLVKPNISSTIPSALRWEIWERDNFTCQYCGSRRDLTIDHIHPVFKGGNNVLSNLTTACRKCNSRKGIKPQTTFRGGKNV